MCAKEKAKQNEKWIAAIPISSAHGSGTYQKKLWRLVSDYVRIRDFYLYGGKCVATGVRIGHWKDGQAGHYKAYNSCDGMFKFDPMNIHLQSARSNSWGDANDGYHFGEELKRRYGEDYLDRIIKENRNHIAEKTDKQAVVAAMKHILSLMETLPEKPDYYQRVMSLVDNP